MLLYHQNSKKKGSFKVGYYKGQNSQYYPYLIFSRNSIKPTQYTKLIETYFLVSQSFKSKP